MKTATLSIRLEPAVLARWKEKHRRSYPEHGLSFAAWLEAQVEIARAVQEHGGVLVKSTATISGL